METFAERIAKSGLFGISNSSAIVTLMLLCQAEGINPLLALRRYHIIEGKPAMRADAMQGEFEREGIIIWHTRTDLEVGATFFRHRSQCDEAGKKRAIERYKLRRRQVIDPPGDLREAALLSDKIADLSMYYEDTVIWTAEEAWRKGISLAKDKQTLKHNWEAYPRQMLSARVVTEGVRLVWPGLIAGIASVEELQDLPAEEPVKSAAPNYLGMTLDQLREAEQREASAYASAYASGDKSAMERLCIIRDRLTEMDDVRETAKSFVDSEDRKHTEVIDVTGKVVAEAISHPQWQSLKCHIGKSNGPLLGRTLRVLFVEPKLHRAEKLMELFDKSRAVTNPTTQEDHALIAALVHAKAFLEERKTKEGGESSSKAVNAPHTESLSSVQSTEMQASGVGQNNAAAKSDPSPAAIEWRKAPIYLPQSEKVHGKPLGNLLPEHLLNLEQMMTNHYMANAGDENSCFEKAVQAAKVDLGFGQPHSVLMQMVTDRIPDNDALSFVTALNSIAKKHQLPEVVINSKAPLTAYNDEQLRRILWLIPKLIPE